MYPLYLPPSECYSQKYVKSRISTTCPDIQETMVILSWSQTVFGRQKSNDFPGQFFAIEFNICFASHFIVPVKCVHISPLQSLVYRRFFEWSHFKKEM